MQNEIRQLTAADLEASLRLSEFAFQYELGEQERVERLKTMKPETQWGFFVDEELAAKLALLPMHTWIGGRKLEFGGIASVATWPEYRRQGMVARLLANALRVMKERGWTLSTLAPFSFPFYRKYGYETYVERKAYELRKDQLPQGAAPEGSFCRTDDLALLGSLYEAYAVRYNGMLARDEDWWRTKVLTKKGRFVVYRSAAGEPLGYIHYRVAERMLTIHEMVWLKEEARRALWAFVRNHDSMAETVKLLAPADDALAFLLPEPRIKQEIMPYFMARIVDVEAFAALYPFAATGETTQLRLRVRDPHAPWNDGAFVLTIDGEGRGRAEREAESGLSTDETTEAERPRTKDATEGTEASGGGQADGGLPEVVCGIGMLTAALLGYRRPAELRALGLLEGSEEGAQLLEYAVPARTPFLLDFF
ncbi:acetyltransferase [Paenibacillus sp. J31TS4]|uniref:GNAT family N-acetyltransferase n=1 Tax=Paenibacillus sp. J31TS4 TaxID=2807195 RepID=UPI001B2B80E1|nr:GNAT family N-acetyltransferase [Paenibacillus sp. J31TS4]GIP40882.1 acetyltransferase [Paenibacillus sp. J31TS4]